MTDASLRVLVTSDTHVRSGAALPDALLLLADRADHVLHAGDVTERDVLDTLAALAPVTAVAGNCDERALADSLDVRTEVVLAGVRIGMLHDAGARGGRHERLLTAFPDAHVVVYGHSHDPELAQTPAGTWVLNPGSPTQRRRAPYHSAIWLELRDASVVSVDLVNLDAPVVGTMSQ